MISDLFIGLGCENVKVSSVFLLFIELWSLFVDLRFVYWVVISGKFSTDQNNGFVHDIHIWMSCHVVLLGFVGLIMISGFVGMWHVRVSCRLYLGSQLPGWRKDAWMNNWIDTVFFLSWYRSNDMLLFPLGWIHL